MAPERSHRVEVALPCLFSAVEVRLAGPANIGWDKWVGRGERGRLCSWLSERGSFSFAAGCLPVFSAPFPAGGIPVPFCRGVRGKKDFLGGFLLDFAAKRTGKTVRWFQKGLAVYKREELIPVWEGASCLRL